MAAVCVMFSAIAYFSGQPFASTLTVKAGFRLHQLLKTQ
jgi:hypothetical protein